MPDYSIAMWYIHFMVVPGPINFSAIYPKGMRRTNSALGRHTDATTRLGDCGHRTRFQGGEMEVSVNGEWTIYL